MKVSELSGNALALWTAKALGYKSTKDLIQIGEAAAGMRNPVIFYSEAGVLGVAGEGLSGRWQPHEDWAQGGPIIDREVICIMKRGRACMDWVASVGVVGIVEFEDDYGWHPGSTPLAAAMRAFVASKYGEEVPDEG